MPPCVDLVRLFPRFSGARRLVSTPAGARMTANSLNNARTESIERIGEQMRLANKVILVTGAARGIARVAAQMFVEQCAKVIAADLNESGLNAAIAEIDAGHRDAIMPVVGNV